MHMSHKVALIVIFFVFSTTKALAATDLPDIKAGLWESRTTMGDTKNIISSSCMDNSVYKKMSDDRDKNPNRPCQVIHAERNGSTYSSEVECKFGKKVTRSTTVITFSGNTAYHSEMRGSANSVEMVIDSKYLGSCPSGMKLGDVTGPQGMKFNVLQP
jgi:Protein of unknown function (DUF3617)